MAHSARETVVPVRAPFRLDLTANVLRRLSSNVVDVFDGTTYRRLIGDPRRPVLLEVRQTGTAVLTVTLTGSAADRYDATTVVERLLGTAADLRGFTRAAASGEPSLSQSLATAACARSAEASERAHRTTSPSAWVAAVAMASVIDDYENAFRAAGYNPGVVLPSTLAALGAADAKRPTLVIKVDAQTTSIAILNENQLQLFRTLENTRGITITGEQLAEEVYPSVVFFQDTYRLNIERIYVAGLPESGGAAPALRAQTGAEVQELVASSQLGSTAGSSVPRWRMAGVVGALIS